MFLILIVVFLIKSGLIHQVFIFLQILPVRFNESRGMKLKPVVAS